MLKRLLLIVFLAGLSSAAWGQDFGLDLGCCSQPLTQASTPVNATGGGVTDYYNSTTNIITELRFAIDVSNDTHFNFNNVVCDSFNFFATCTKSMNGSTLFLDFSGINKTDSDGVFGNSTDPETQQTEGTGVFEGLPTLTSEACLSTPDIAACSTGVNDRGHFLISFDNFITTTVGDSTVTSINNDANGNGGWMTGTSASIDEINGVFVPEPSSAAFLVICLLLIGGLGWRRARRHA